MIRAMWNPEDTDLAGIPALVKSLLQIQDEPEQQKESEDKKMKKYVCGPCGYVYDPAVGDPDSGIAPGTAFEDLPDDWCCPVCGVSKDMFEPEE